ncbi:hypothetical protein IAU60_003725 [Kwoniella sp. DSM 27419]
MPGLTKEDDRSAAIFTVVLVMAVLATTFTSLRMVSKGWIVRKITSDDWVTVLAWVFCLASAICILIGTRVGLGRIGSEIKPEWVAPLRKSTYAFTVFYNPAIMTIKVAILILYIRMSAAHRFLRWASVATMVVVALTGVICTLIVIFQCRPVHAAWSYDPNAKCIDVISLYLSSAPINILTDLAILLLPLPILTSLRMEFRQKVVLVTTFVVGGFVTIVDVVRIAYLQQALKSERLLGQSTTVSGNARFSQSTYYISFALMWSSIESSVGLMCCCVLVLKPLVMRVIPAMLREGRDSTPSGQPQTDTVMLTHLSASPRNQLPDPRRALTISNHDPKWSEAGLDPRATVSVSIAPPLGGASAGRPRSNTLAAQETALTVDEDEEMDFFQMLQTGPTGAQAPPQNPVAPALSPALLQTTGQGMAPILPVPSASPPKFSSITRHLSKQRTRRASSNAKRVAREASQAPSGTFFDFVNMGGHKQLTELTAKEAFGPVCFASILFLLWGFSYGLLGTLNGEIQVLLGFAPSQNLALHSAYWVGYFFGPIVSGYWILHRHGFKYTFVTGLAIFSAGAMAFWPSAVLLSYAGFFISNFMVALGLSTLETAANPFIALCGPGELSEARLNFAQAIQAVGSLGSSILANKVLFNAVSQDKLFKVQWCYLAVSIFVLFLAAVFFYAPLSEASDDALEQEEHVRADNAGISRESRTIGIPNRTFLLILGAYMMFSYVSCQESISFAWNPVVRSMKPSVDPFWMHTIGQAVFALGRLVAAGACYIGIPPRAVIAVSILGSFITALLAMVMPTPSDSPLVSIILHMFFESPIFPTLFAMAIRGQGRRTKLASAVLIMAICGGAIFPPVIWKLERSHQNDLPFALIVVVALYGASLMYPTVLNGSPTLRRWVDPRWSRSKLEHSGSAVQMNGSSPLHDQASGLGSDKIPAREEVGLQSHGMVGLGLNLNGGALNETVSFGSIATRTKKDDG